MKSPSCITEQENPSRVSPWLTSHTAKLDFRLKLPFYYNFVLPNTIQDIIESVLTFSVAGYTCMCLHLQM